MPSESQIPAPRVPVTGSEGGVMTREWFRFFNYIYEQILALNSPTTTLAYGSFKGFETTTWGSYVTTRVAITDTALSSNVSVAGSQVTVANAGLYSVSASFQLYNPDLSIPYSVILWARVSGVDVPGSLRYVTIPANNLGGGQSFTSHCLNLTLQLPAAAYIEFYGFSAGGIAQLRTLTANETGVTAPSSASIILNVTQIA